MISVLMPVYNGAKFLDAAIVSILTQTFREFEFVIVDDGSSDETAAIVARHAARDSRIRLVRRPHLGYCAALNTGLDHCRFDWFAMMDSDDVALPTRLERQYALAQTDPDVVVWGTDGYHINSRGEVLSSFRVGPTSKEECRRLRAKGEIVQAIHPTALLRREIAVKAGGYIDVLQPAPDIDLFDRMLRYGDLVTIPEPLVKYRIHAGSLSMTKAARMAMIRRFVMARQRHRMKTSEELTLPEFLNEDKRRPFRTRVRDWITRTGNVLYRQGGLHYGERNFVKAALFLMGALVLRPVHSTRRVWTQVFSRRARRHIRMHRSAQQAV